MRKIRDALRLTHAMGMSRRLVGEATGIGKTAVGEYVRRAAAAGLSWPIADEIDDAELARRLFRPAAAGLFAARADPDWSQIHREMKRRGVTLALLWQEYRSEHAQGYAYSWFCERYSDWRKRITPTMRQTHVAGEKLFVDWAGDAIPVFDPITGAEHGARIFVAALGASNYLSEARWTETLPDWIGAHVNAPRSAAYRRRWCPTTEKGALSIYGMGRFPVTLYKEQWLRLLDMSSEIRAFIAANEAQLKAKG